MRKPITGHPDSLAWDEWIKSSNGLTCLDVNILHNPEDVKYLKNRLWTAYMAACEMRTEREFYDTRKLSKRKDVKR